MIGTIFQWLGCFALSLAVMSFIEHQVHQILMHRTTGFRSRFRLLRKVFEHHAVLHHGTYRTKFSDEPVATGQDRGIRLSVMEGFLEALPATLIFALICVPLAVSFVSVVGLHHLIWNQIHLEMHKPRGRFFSRWSAYRFLARHHFMHHRHPHTNLNVILPLADYILGTNARPSLGDWRALYRAGLIDSRTATSLRTAGR